MCLFIPNPNVQMSTFRSPNNRGEISFLYCGCFVMKKQTISYQGFKLEGNFREMALLECSDLSLVNEKWLALTGLALAFFLLEPIFQPVGSRHSRAIFSAHDQHI